MIKQLPTFPAAPRYYSEDVANDIVAHYIFRNGDVRNEVGYGQPVTLTSSTVEGGKLKTTDSAASTYSFPIEYFGAGDFTIEFNFKVLSVLGDALPLFVHWYNGGITNDNNRYSIGVLPNLTIQMVFANSGARYDYSAQLSSIPITIGREHHFVVEREGGTVTAFLDGVQCASWQQAAPLWAKTNNVVNGHFYNASGYGQREIWNIRVARRAVYKGKVPRPSIRLFKHTIPLVLKSWSKPLASDGHGMQSAGVTLDGVSYIFGGRVGAGIAAVSTVSSHDGKSVKPVAIMPEALVTHTAALYGREVYIFGGFSGSIHDAGASNKLLVFNVDTFAFRYVSPCPVTMTSPGSAIVGDTLYVGGGYPNTVEGTVITAYYAYHIPTDTWTQLPDHPESFAISGLFAHHGKLYTFGGERSAGTVRSNKVYCYDPLSGTWENITPIYGPSGRSCHGVSFDKDSFVIVGGRIGGYTAVPSAEVWSFNTVTKSWTRLADMLTPISFCTVLARNGMLHITDGYYNNAVIIPGGYLLR